jgi:vacuolar protein sorting-associated protein 13D
VDFLGSPLGFVNDVTEGVSGLLFEGNVQALVQNVTHGLSNSAAKVTGRTELVSGFMNMHRIV